MIPNVCVWTVITFAKNHWILPVHSNVTSKNVSWLHFSWPTLYTTCCTCTCSVMGRQAEASNSHILGPQCIQTILQRVDWWSLYDQLRKPVPVSDNSLAEEHLMHLWFTSQDIQTLAVPSGVVRIRSHGKELCVINVPLTLTAVVFETKKPSIYALSFLSVPNSLSFSNSHWCGTLSNALQ